MIEELEKRAMQYAKRRDLRLGRRLGVGMHGMVFEGKNNSKFGGHIALKLHESEIPYRRERVAYERLAELRIDRICGCDVPRALHFDDEFLAIAQRTYVPRMLAAAPETAGTPAGVRVFGSVTGGVAPSSLNHRLHAGKLPASAASGQLH